MRVSLTFDAEHPDRANHDHLRSCREILEILAREQITATFFMQGAWVDAYPPLAAMIATTHVVGSHSYHHANLPLLTDSGIQRDLALARRAIIEATGTDPRPLFRLPRGDGLDDPRVMYALKLDGYDHQHWTHSTRDWNPQTSVVEAAVRGSTNISEGSVVLLHTWPARTPAILTLLISRLRDLGSEFTDLAAGSGRLPRAQPSPTLRGSP